MQGHESVGRPSEETEVKSYLVCRTHQRMDCRECLVKSRHVCNAMIGTEVTLECGCVAPLLACDLAKRVTAKMPVVDGKLNGCEVKVLRDTLCSTIVVNRRFVKDDELTGRTIVCVMIYGTAKEYPTAVCMDQPLYDVIIGK